MAPGQRRQTKPCSWPEGGRLSFLPCGGTRRREETQGGNGAGGGQASVSVSRGFPARTDHVSFFKYYLNFITIKDLLVFSNLCPFLASVQMIFNKSLFQNGLGTKNILLNDIRWGIICPLPHRFWLPCIKTECITLRESLQFKLDIWTSMYVVCWYILHNCVMFEIRYKRVSLKDFHESKESADS